MKFLKMKRGVFLKLLSSYWSLFTDNEKSCLFGMCCGAFRRQSTLNSYQATHFLAEISSMVFQMSDDVFLSYVEEAKAFYPSDIYDERSDNIKKDDHADNDPLKKTGSIVLYSSVSSKSGATRKRKVENKDKRKKKAIKSEPPTVKESIGETIDRVLKESQQKKREIQRAERTDSLKKLKSDQKSSSSKVEKEWKKEDQETFFSLVSKKFFELMKEKSTNAFLKQVSDDYKNLRKKRLNVNSDSDVHSVTQKSFVNKFARVEIASGC